jgi:hypothetical protein
MTGGATAKANELNDRARRAELCQVLSGDDE